MASKYSMNDRPSWPRRAIVTAGEPYGNKGLHFGHVGGVFVPADFFARFLRDRLGRENVIFTSGTDCYGSPIMESYRKLKENEGYDKSIGEYVESNHSRQAATLNNYNISCDIYGGSGLEPAAQIHNEVTAEIIERLHEQGTISKRSTLQFYDAKAGTFLNGRQVIGRCPIQGCKSEKAYADECDLGHQFEPEELIAPKSQLTGEVPELRPVDNLYFDLPAYLDFMKTYTAKLAQNPQVRSVVSKTMEEWLLPAQLYIQNKFREAFDAVEGQLPEHTVLEPEGNKSSFTVTFPSWKERDDAHAVLANGGVRFRSGKALVPFRITGNIDWGVPVPEVDGVTDVTCWCWPESLWAPISYTRTVLARDAKAAGVTEGVAAQDAALMGEPAADSTQVPAPTYQHSSLDWRDWWCSDDAQIYQFIGQDNIYFYCIAQTAMWEALGWDLTQSTVSACYHLLYMGKKASSSSQTPPPPADDLLNHYTCEQMRAHWLSLGLSEKPVSFSPKAYDTRVTGKDKDGNAVMKEWWNVTDEDIDAMLKATDWCPADLGYFRGGGYSSHFKTQAVMPMTMIRVNIIKGLGPVLQIAEGYTATLPDEIHNKLDMRTDPTWPTTWFAPRLTGKGAFKDVYSVMANWGANHGAISYGHIGKDLITLASMLRIPVAMHNVADEDIYRPHAWSAFGTKDLESADYRACAAYGPLYK